MNVRQIEYILAVAETRHFGLAAEKCFVGQSTLSTMVIKFEDEIGIKIFDRSKKPIELTPEGRIIIDKLKLINKEIYELKDIVKELKGEDGGSVSIGIIPTVAPFLLPLFLQNFVKRFPKLQIEIREITTNQIIKQIETRELDVGILSTPLNVKPEFDTLGAFLV